MQRSGCVVALEVGGSTERPDWPKLGPSLLIATCLILAIRTAKWTAGMDEKFSNHELEKEIDHAIHLASSVLARLVSRKEAIFPQRREPWYQPNDDDIPK